eukprot:scaffold20941_cov143-Skeletonema_marinoi.AAC.8
MRLHASLSSGDGGGFSSLDQLLMSVLIDVENKRSANVVTRVSSSQNCMQQSEREKCYYTCRAISST